MEGISLTPRLDLGFNSVQWCCKFPSFFEGKVMLRIVSIILLTWLLFSIIMVFAFSCARGVLMDREYVDLDEDAGIDFTGFSFKDYVNGERTILQPQLEARGYTDIKWYMGEYDSFGPLTRVCEAKSSNGERIYFIYG